MPYYKYIFFLLSFLSFLFTSCNTGSGKIETITYSTQLTDSIRIPKYTRDFNQFIKDSLFHQSVVYSVYAMLNYQPEESFTYPFEYFENRASLRTYTSPDSMLRFYSFSIDYYNSSSTLIQYKDSKGRILTDYFMPVYEGESEVLWQRLPPPNLTEEEEEYYSSRNAGIVNDVHTIVDDRGNKFYLVDFMTPTTTQEVFHDMVALNIVDDTPQKVPLFNTGKKRVDLIDVYLPLWHYDDWMNQDSMFVYNPATRNLYIPHMQDDEFQNEYLIYQFDGVEFKYTGIR